MNNLLAGMLVSPQRPAWRRQALDYAAGADIFSLHERAAEIIESVAARISS